ncbi:MAG: hypothetical protein M3503_07380, partial [Actinomycetota bacterium]|nr:hypothetical protein [Actinomycetota bacterium]
MTLAKQDHVAMGTVPTSASGIAPKAATEGTVINRTVLNPEARAAYEAQTGWGIDDRVRGTSDVYVEMARDFGHDLLELDGVLVSGIVDPTLRFPVLLHWSFTSFGNDTFELLMKRLDSGMLATQGAPDPDHPEKNPEPSSGRLPLEVVETGHVGLPHRLRRGDEVRSWYRGPLLPHPADEEADRLNLAHAADQIRVVVPDGREDVSLAAAFEIGRLLGLSRPSMVASLMRWRQLKFQQARLGGVVHSGTFRGLDMIVDLDRFIGGRLGAEVVRSMIATPEKILGDPAPLVTAGRPVLEDGSPNNVLADGFGLARQALDGDPLVVLQNLRDADIRRPRVDVFGDPGLVKNALAPALDARFSRASVGALATSLTEDVLTSGGISCIPLDLGLAFSDLVLGPALVGGLTLLPADVGPGPFPHGAGGDPLDGLIEEERRRARQAQEDQAQEDEDR